jgi:D-alanyl-lipoteichoic acid acyltransferase DltB (MBOAT superfamily)
MPIQKGYFSLTALSGQMVHALSEFVGFPGSHHLLWLSPLPMVAVVGALVPYYLLGNRIWQNAILLVVGGVVTWSVCPLSTVFLFGSAIADVAIVSGMCNSRTQADKAFLFCCSLGMNSAIALLVLSRTLQELLLAGVDSAGIRPIVAPLFSKGFPGRYFVYVLVAKLTLPLDAYSDRFEKRPDWLDACVFSTFFCRYIGLGMPCDRARSTLPFLASSRRWSWLRAEEALFLCLVGAVKLSLFIGMDETCTRLLGRESSGMAILAGAWIYPVQTYLWMAGLTDVARGLAKLYGIDLPSNFDGPLMCKNITEFWRRWNITIMNLLSEDVFSRINFALRRWELAGVALACFATFLVSGLAHGLTLSILVWGAVQSGAFVVHLGTHRKVKRWSKAHGNPAWMPVLGWFLTANVIVFSWSFLSYDSMRATIHALASLVTGPVWPSWCGEIGWGRVLVMCSIAFVLQAVPHYKGGDSWMLSARPWLRRFAGLGVLSMLVYYALGR